MLWLCLRESLLSSTKTRPDFIMLLGFWLRVFLDLSME
uniref:Uncharacterized protein n=1 Tax=Populus trichocarpa TaxID=3694 RepID=A9PG87_POPTR|nr:unknown [Populus trichocarpa]